MFRKRKEENKKGAPMWMTTFSDLMTLVLVFFILLFAFSEIDATKFKMIAMSFQGIFDDNASFFFENPLTSPVENSAPPHDMNKRNRVDEDSDQQSKDKGELDKLFLQVKKYLQENNLEGVVVARQEKRGIELILQESVLFDSGQAIVKKEAIPFLDRVADLLETLPNEIEVEGHTDSQRIIQPSQYKSNWNLSGDRAANVVNYFLDKHYLSKDRFKISGYADTEPVDVNTTVQGRLKNRRVVIVILDN